MPAVTPIPELPIRATMTDEDFSQQVGESFAAIPLFITELNAFAEAMNLNSTNGTSATSLFIENATKNLTVEPGKSYVPGQTLKIASTASPTNWMVGDVLSYNTGTGLLSVAAQYKQGSGTFAAWTISLSPPVPVTIPSGSKTVWFQAAAPTGWTQDTTHNDKALRIVSGAGGGTGGSVAFATAFASKAVTGTNSPVTLDNTNIPAHTHTYERAFTGSGNGLGGSSPYITVGSVTASGSYGSSGAHNHAFTGTAINLAVQYVDMIIATKD